APVPEAVVSGEGCLLTERAGDRVRICYYQDEDETAVELHERWLVVHVSGTKWVVISNDFDTFEEDDDRDKCVFEFKDGALLAGGLQDAAAQMEQVEVEKAWEIEGPCWNFFVCEGSQGGSQGSVRRLYWWRFVLGPAATDVGVDEDLLLSQLGVAFLTMDRVQTCDLATFELCSLRCQMCESAYADLLREVDTATARGDDLLSERSLVFGVKNLRSNTIVTARFEDHVTMELAVRAAVPRECRKAREEAALSKGSELSTALAAVAMQGAKGSEGETALQGTRPGYADEALAVGARANYERGKVSLPAGRSGRVSVTGCFPSASQRACPLDSCSASPGARACATALDRAGVWLRCASLGLWCGCVCAVILAPSRPSVGRESELVFAAISVVLMHPVAELWTTRRSEFRELLRPRYRGWAAFGDSERFRPALSPRRRARSKSAAGFPPAARLRLMASPDSDVADVAVPEGGRGRGGRLIDVCSRESCLSFADAVGGLEGAGLDRLVQVRSLSEVQPRKRWPSFRSIARCDEHAQGSWPLGRFPEAVQAAIARIVER
ncbi:unnamed protein product, partial [Prorocentrum cordatum]